MVCVVGRPCKWPGYIWFENVCGRITLLLPAFNMLVFPVVYFISNQILNYYIFQLVDNFLWVLYVNEASKMRFLANGNP